MIELSPVYPQCILNRAESKYHWSPESQPYAPVHILQSLLSSAWLPAPSVTLSQYSLSSWQNANVYTLTLFRDDTCFEISVLENPIVLRLIEQYILEVQ